MGCALQAAIRLAFIAVLTKHLDEARYGYWSLLVATAEILSPLAALGLTFGFMRFNAGLDDRRQVHRNFLGAAVAIVISAAAVSLLLSALSAQFARAFMDSSPLGRRVVGAGAALVLCTALEWCLRFYYSTSLQMHRRALLATGRFVLELVAALIAVARGWDVVQIVQVIVAARAIPSAIALASILARKGLARPDFRQVRAAIAYGLPMQLASTAGTLIRFSDRHVLGALRPSADVGAYAATYEIAASHLLVVVAIEAVLLPVLAALANRGQPRRARWMYLAALKFLLIVTVPAAVVLCVAANPLLTLVTTEAYALHGRAAEPWIAWAAVCYAVAIVARCPLAVAHRTVRAMALMWGAVALKIVLLIVCIRWLGILGAGVATFATFFLLMVATLLASRGLLAPGAGPAPPDDRPPPTPPLTAWSLVATALAAAAAGIPLYLLEAPRAGRLLVALAAYGVVYVLALFALRAIRVGELRAMWRQVRSRPEAEPGATDDG